jgi:Holliday junction resolvasome RuvABC endonuclease subunit
MTKTLLALDLGTTTGWALRTSDRRIVSGTHSFKPQRFEGGGMRFLRFVRWLDELQTLSGGLRQLAFEEVRRHASTDAAHAYGGFLGQLTAWCEQRQIPYQGVPVGTIKKHATGKGNANKDAMLDAVRGWGYAPVDDNESDALALLHWAIAQECSA